MRRKEKAVTKPAELYTILWDASYITLAIPDGDEIYQVPLSFGMSGGLDDSDEPLHIWIHSADKGRKWELLTGLSGRDVALSFSAVAEAGLKDGGEQACSYSAYFRSVTGSGHFVIVKDPEEKLRGLEAIMAHYRPERSFAFPEGMVAKTGVIMLRVTKLRGKRNLPEGM